MLISCEFTNILTVIFGFFGTMNAPLVKAITALLLNFGNVKFNEASLETVHVPLTSVTPQPADCASNPEWLNFVTEFVVRGMVGITGFEGAKIKPKVVSRPKTTIMLNL